MQAMIYVVGVRWSAATMGRLMSGASTALRSGLSSGGLLGRVGDRSSSALAWYALYFVHVPIRGVLMSFASFSVTLIDACLFPHLRVIVRVWVRTLFAPVLFVCGNVRTSAHRARERGLKTCRASWQGREEAEARHGAVRALARALPPVLRATFRSVCTFPCRPAPNVSISNASVRRPQLAKDMYLYNLLE